jgi:glycosyltransferase involved in cell wall biosynthesis
MNTTLGLPEPIERVQRAGSTSRPGNKRPIRVLELRSVRGTGGGPEKTILGGAALSDRSRYKITVCYLRDARDPVFALDARARGLGLDYVEVVERHSFDPSVWPALRRLVRERRIDVVHAHEHKTDLLALLLARCEGVLPLATAHGWSGTSLKERGYYFVDRRLLRYYPLVIAVSEPIRQTLVRHGARPERVRKVLNGIDHEACRHVPGERERMRDALGIPQEATVIGAIGRLEPIKRFDLLVEAMARLEPGVFAVIAGEGSSRRALEALAADRGVTARFRLLGHRDDPLAVHHVLDVYVQTSDSEGIPNAVLEAMALQIPVVATNVGGTSELIGDEAHGLLVPRRDAQALVHAIGRTLTDRPGTAARVRAARERIERDLSFASRNAALEAIYDELMAARVDGGSTR